MRDQKLLSQKKIVVGSTIFLVIVTFLCGFLVVRLGHERQHLVDTLATETAKETELILLKKDLSASVPKLEKMEDAYVSKEEVPAYLKRIESIASKNGLRYAVSSLAISETAGKKSLRTELVASGPYQSLTAFMSQIEVLPYVLSINSFELVASTVFRGEWEVKMSIMLYSYGDK